MPCLSVRVSLVLALVLAAPLAGPGLGPSSAAAEPPPSDPRAAARAAFSAGVGAFEAGDFARARDAFARAYALSPHPAVQLNMAYCEERLGQLRAAREHYRAYLASGAASSEEQAEVEVALTRIGANLASLLVTLEPSSARLSVDGEPVAWSPGRPLELDPGAHVVRAELADGASAEQRLQLAPSATAQVELRVIVASAVPVPESAAVPGRRPLRVWAAGAGLLTVAASASAVGTGVLARHVDDDFSTQVRVANDPGASAAERAEAVSTGQHAAERADRLARTTDALLGCAVGLAAITTTLLVIDHKRARAEREQLRYGSSVAPLRGGAVLTLSGRF
jgi:hypothetical protein